MSGSQQLDGQLQVISQIKLNHIIKSTHALLQQTNRLMQSRIYPNAAGADPEYLMSHVSYLHGLVDKHPQLVSELVKQLSDHALLPLSTTGLNDHPTTIIDALALFGSVNGLVRQRALQQFNREIESAKLFIEALLDFDSDFIKPIETRMTSASKFGRLFASTMPLNASKAYLIALIALVFDVFHVELPLNEKAKGIHANQQIQSINEHLALNNPLFTLDPWVIASQVKRDTKLAFNDMVLALLQVLPALKQLNWIARLLALNNDYLSRSRFQRFLVKRLQDLHDKQQALIHVMTAFIHVEQKNMGNQDIVADLAHHERDLSAVWLMTQSATALKTDVQQTVDLIETLVLKAHVTPQELDLIASIKRVDDRALFDSVDEFNSFYQDLSGGLDSQLVIPSSDASFKLEQFVSAAAGGIGFATSYYQSKLFKDALNPQRKEDEVPEKSHALSAG